MIISRTPFRISFFGGGTDYPAFYEEHGGAVLSTAINKYCYITCRYLPPFFNYRYLIRYSRHEVTQTISEIKHPSARECLNFIELEHGVEIQHHADLPAMSGLGSSSSFTVGLLNALYTLKGEMPTKKQLALDAIHVEQNRIKENVGSQDQTVASFGGFNKIEFGGSQKVTVYPIILAQDRLHSLEEHLMLFFTGSFRNASDIAVEQIKKTIEKTTELKTMLEMVDESLNILCDNKDRLADFGKLLHESWMLKRALTPHITTSAIDAIYDTALKAGATGGKLLGAGGGGFILFFVRLDFQQKVREELSNLLYVPFKFQNLGSQIVYYAPEEDFWKAERAL